MPAPPNAPEYGGGPANITNQGDTSPFAGFDNRIRYQDMARYQMVSQYRQNVVQPATMTLSQMRAVGSESRFQYGVHGGQENIQRLARRQNKLGATGFTTAVASGLADFAAFELASNAAMAMGATGIASTMVLPALAMLPASMMMGSSIHKQLQKKAHAQSMASDLDQNRGRLGFTGGLSYGAATSLGTDISNMFYNPKGSGMSDFFSSDQMAKISKIAVSNDMVSAKSRGAGSGTTGQYKKNLKELISTTEDVVKMLQTTIEGGMSVIKEMNQIGFKDLGQIKQQIVQAKAIGKVTGMGFQNTMQVGAAGAQAVQGTPFDASVGASMYQMGAASASNIANMSAAGAKAVARAGGVAQAGGAIANFQMNVMNSGMGSRMLAYGMDPKTGGINKSAMQGLMTGGLDATDIMIGSSGVGVRMGMSGRALFDKNKMDVMNDMSDRQRQKLVASTFGAWSQNRMGASPEARAWTFAKQFSPDMNQARVNYEMLMTGGDFYGVEAAAGVERVMAAQNVAIKAPRGRVGKAIGRAWKATTGKFDDMAESFVEGSEYVAGTFQRVGTAFRRGMYDIETGLMGRLGIGGPFGSGDPYRMPDPEKGLRIAAGLAPVSNLAVSGERRLQAGVPVSKNVRDMMKGTQLGPDSTRTPWTANSIIENINKNFGGDASVLGPAMAQLTGVLATGDNRTLTQLRQNASILAPLGILKGDRNLLGMEEAAGTLASLYKYKESTNTKFQKVTGRYRDFITDKGTTASDIAKNEEQYRNMSYESALGGRQDFVKKYEGKNNMNADRIIWGARQKQAQQIVSINEADNIIAQVRAPIMAKLESASSSYSSVSAGVNKFIGLGTKIPGTEKTTLVKMQGKTLGKFAKKYWGMDLYDEDKNANPEAFDRLMENIMSLDQDVLDGKLAPENSEKGKAQRNLIESLGGKEGMSILRKDIGDYSTVQALAQRGQRIKGYGLQLADYDKGKEDKHKIGKDRRERFISGLEDLAENRMSKKEALKFFDQKGMGDITNELFGISDVSIYKSNIEKYGVPSVAANMFREKSNQGTPLDLAQKISESTSMISRLEGAKRGAQGSYTYKDEEGNKVTLKREEGDEILADERVASALLTPNYLASMINARTQGTSMNANVRSGIMNYWNNSWTN